jgi:polysaccharide biosynthesis protein PslH
MKKILAIAPYPYLPYFSGGQKFIANFFSHLGNETNLTVAGVKTNDWSKAANYKPLPVLKSSFSRYFNMGLINVLVKEIKRERHELLIIEHPYFSWLANALKKRTGIRTAIHTHNIEYQRFRSTGRWWWPLLKYYERKAFRSADLLLFITPEDKNFAIDNWKVDENKCLDIPYGIDQAHHPTDRSQTRQAICSRYKIDPSSKIYFFNGLLGYRPNYEALKIILEKINPILIKNTRQDYKILVCGKDLPAEFNGLNDHKSQNVIYGGFTDQIGEYYKASDLFINPVLSGGGVKTKVVEAIGYGTTVISTESGAAGMIRQACGEKLVTVKDYDWNAFSEAIDTTAGKQIQTPQSYYDIYYWGNIIRQFKNL